MLHSCRETIITIVTQRDCFRTLPAVAVCLASCSFPSYRTVFPLATKPSLAFSSLAGIRVECSELGDS